MLYQVVPWNMILCYAMLLFYVMPRHAALHCHHSMCYVRTINTKNNTITYYVLTEMLVTSPLPCRRPPQARRALHRSRRPRAVLSVDMKVRGIFASVEMKVRGMSASVEIRLRNILVSLT